jgi:beta-N-acetylhexosaminidase
MNLEYDDKYGYHMPLKVDKCFGILPSKRCFLIQFSVIIMLIMMQTSLPLWANSIAMKVKQQASTQANKTMPALTTFEQQIAQRMSLDIRYFCADINGQPSVPSSKHCRQPLTHLPKELAQLISSTSLGGIVLFAENVENTEQIVTLTHDIQQAALLSSRAKPAIIAIDQEGGRVARFAGMTGFAGNMAIGASYPEHGTHFSKAVNTIIAKELKVLGINNNYAPVVDVNTNTNNPVINTRSFGESAEQVAKLGATAVTAIQSQGIMATLKHFPGHGDTHVDSHLGLPRVDHSRAIIDKVDLAPFAWAIKHAQPAMIMTAHIQYPALDNSAFINDTGDSFIRPATMSRKILTDLLRQKMEFNGIIATDALDMAGISHFFNDVEAVVETFVAGADLAVMPFKVRTPNDALAFHGFVKAVADALLSRIERGDYTMAEFEQSIQRLNHYSDEYIEVSKESLASKVELATKIIANDLHLNVEQALADAAVTVLKQNQLLPVNLNPIKHIYLLAANQQELAALINALEIVLGKKASTERLASLVIHKFNAQSASISGALSKIISQINPSTDMLIASVDIKTASLVDLGGMDDLTPSYGSARQQQTKLTYQTMLTEQLKQAKNRHLPTVLIAKGSPFLLAPYRGLVDTLLLNYDDRIYQNNQQQFISPGFNASMQVIFDTGQAQGQLPVTLKQ